MGETTYVMHPVAYTSIYSVQEHPKESAMHAALSQSISFGRFMSESLSWERWSTFTSKKYVEEAERFSQPGSVAQKKAFFEAHYKGISSAKKPNLSPLTSSPRNSPIPKLDTIKEEEYQEEEEDESNIKSTVLLDELKAMANEIPEVAVEITCCLHEEESDMKFESSVTHTCDDKNEEETREMEIKLNNEENEEEEESSENEEESFENEESSSEIEEESFENEEESSETSLLEETDTDVVESQCQLDKQESMKMELNEEAESESPCTEYHSLKQEESVCSEEGLGGSIEEDSCSSTTPIDEKMIVTLDSSPHKKKSTARWLKPLRVTPSKEFNLFSLTVKNKPNKTRNSTDQVAANGSKNNPKGRSPSSSTMFKQFWSKCSKKLLLSSFKLRNEEKARRKKEKLEKKPRKWGLTHCFKPSPYKKNHREKEKMEDQIKLIAMSRPYAPKSSKETHCKGKTTTMARND